MIKSVAVVALSLATAVFAQNGIPTGISSSCSTFLNTLNTNTEISACLTNLIDTTSDFDPSHTGSTNSSAVQTTLDRICAPSFQSCPESTIRGMLANFWASCSTDMLGSSGDGTNGNKDVISIYDVLYLIIPLKNALCTKEGNQYCVNVIASENANSTTVSASSSSSASAASPSASTPAKRSVDPAVLYRRADNTTGQETLGTVAPEADQYNTLGVPYLFITTNLTEAQLCTPCTADVIGQYINFESTTPYSLGLSNSPMLSGQIKLWKNITNCPDNYASNLLNNHTPSQGSSGALPAFASSGVAQVLGAVTVALVGGLALF